MNTFWIGIIITFISKVGLILDKLINLKGFYLNWRRFLIWLPSAISLSFITGMLITILLQSKDSADSFNALLVVLFWFLNLFLGYSLENNYFILNRSWELWRKQKLFYLSVFIYVINLIISILPFIIYFNVTKIGLFIPLIIIIIVAALYIFTYNNILAAAENEIRLVLATIIIAYNRNSFVVFNDDEKEIFFQNGNSKELEIKLENIKNTLTHIYYFSPKFNGSCLPGISNSIIPLCRINELKEEVVTEILKTNHIDLNKLRFLLGTEVESQEALSSLVEMGYNGDMEKLKQKRNQLNGTKF